MGWHTQFIIGDNSFPDEWPEKIYVMYEGRPERNRTYVEERTCELVETEVDYPNGVKMRGVFCTACGHVHCGELGWFWEYCPRCGAKVVE